MISHSLIVCALLAFSLASQAGAMPLDDGGVEAVAALNAVLHRDVGLHQGGNDGKDVVEAHALDDCKSASVCADHPVVTPAKVQTLDEWFAVKKNSSDANPLVALLLILTSTFFYLRRAISTK